MRALFWRRKNARLATRLNTLVETSERARKTRRRKPSKVVIDTSYLDQADAQAVLQTTAAQNDALQAETHAVPLPAVEDGTPATEAYEQEVDPGDLAAHAVHASEDDLEEASVLLHEAVEQLDLAEAGLAQALEREEKALQEIEAQRARLEELEAGLASAQTARDVAEQALQTEQNNVGTTARAQFVSTEGDAETLQELETHRAMVASLSADLRREKKTHAQAVADRDAAAGLAAAAELKLSHLQDSQAEYEAQHDELATRAAAADARVAAAEARATAAEARAAVAVKDAESDRARNAQLETEISQAQAACDDAERSKTTAEERTTELEGEIAALRQAAADAVALEQRALDAESDAAQVRATLSDAQSQIGTLTEQVEDAERTRAELRDVSAQLAAAEQKANDSANRATDAEAALETQRTAVTELTDEIATAQTAFADAETAHAARVAQLDNEIAELHAAATQHAADLDEHIGPLREEADTQRDAASRLTIELKNLREILADAETDKEALTARASASERRLVEAQSTAAQMEGKLRAELEALRAELDAIGATVDGHGSQDGSVVGGDDRQRTVAGDQARTAQIENERDVLRRQLAEVQRSAEASAELARDKDQELAELREALAERAAVHEDHNGMEQRVADAHRELEAERQRVADIVAELDQERAARAVAETRLNDTLKQSADDDTDAFAVGGTVELEPAPAEAVETAKADPVEADMIEQSRSAASAVAEIVTLPTQAEETPLAPVPAIVQKRDAPPPKRGNRIASKPQRSGVSTAALNVTGPASRVDSVIQNRMAKATAKKEAAKENRRAKRVASRKLASLWQDGMSAGLSCTMLDRSSTGAKLEVLTDRFNDRMNEINVGDRFTVTQTYAQERTSVACEVMWVNGQRCGVRFCGQIHTEIQKPAKRALPKQPEKTSTSSAIKSLFGAGAR